MTDTVQKLFSRLRLTRHTSALLVMHPRECLPCKELSNLLRCVSVVTLHRLQKLLGERLHTVLVRVVLLLGQHGTREVVLGVSSFGVRRIVYELSTSSVPVTNDFDLTGIGVLAPV